MLGIVKFLPDSPFARFFTGTLLWLPVWLVAWYQLSGFLVAPVIQLARGGVELLNPGLIEKVEPSARNLVTFVTSLRVAVPGEPTGTMGNLVIEMNPLIYCWNLPVMLALLFATDSHDFSFRRLLWAYLFLLPFQAWGVMFDILKSLAIDMGPEVHARLAFSPTTREMIALGYQFGYLMLPVIGGISVWMGMNRGLLHSILQYPNKPVANYRRNYRGH